MQESSQTVDVKYEICSKLGGGSFGDIFFAKNRKTGEEVAAKVEATKAIRRREDGKKVSQLLRETKIYFILNGEGNNFTVDLF